MRVDSGARELMVALDRIREEGIPTGFPADVLAAAGAAAKRRPGRDRDRTAERS
ncbi:MAG: hypothetical protein R2697_17550 [Ilumatobacteraceae bacterium]